MHLLLVLALVGSSSVAQAAGLGRIDVLSALGQPLRAEIELINVPKEDVDLLVPKMASAEEYQRAGLERPEGAQGFRLVVEKRPSGEPYIRLTSPQPINEPFVQLLVQLDWPSGRLLRAYTVLLDPPAIQERPAVATVTPAAVPAPRAAPAQSPAAVLRPGVKPEAAQARSEAEAAKSAPLVRALTPAEETFPRFEEEAREPQPTAVAPAVAAQEANYTVRAGDTLARIAGQFKPEGVDLDQMLVALFEKNRAAFAGDNMNRLKAGQILKLPTSDEVRAVGPEQARQEVKAHAARWEAYRQKLASAAAEAKPAAGESGGAAQEATGKIRTKVEEKAAKPAAEAPDVLRLSKGAAVEARTKGQPAAAEVSALNDKLAQAQEEVAAKEKALQEANARIAELEKNVQDMRRLLELRNKELAELSAKTAAPAQVSQAASAPAPAPAAVPAPPAAKPEALGQAPAPAPAAEPTQPKASPAAPAAQALEPQAKPKPKPKPAPKVEPVPEPSLVDEFLANPLYVAGGGAVVVGGLLALLWAVGRRRRKSLASFEDSILTGGDLKANTVFGNTGGGQIDTGDTSFLTDFSQAGMGAIDTHDVDPIAEAEVYMAYGRDAQAEEILKEAIAKDPNRHEVRLKLLEIYAGRRNKDAFETVATELYAATGGQGPIWEKAAELGRGIDPDNPLYAAHGGAPASSALASGAAATAAVAAAAGQAEAAESTSAESAMHEATFDFTLDLDQATLPGGATEAPLELELETETPAAPALSVAAPPAAVPPEEAPSTTSSPLDATLALDLDTLIPQAVEKQQGSPSGPAAQDEAPLEFELELPEIEETGSEGGARASSDVGSDTLAGLSFDFDLETPTTSAPAPVPPAEVPGSLTGLDLSNLEPSPASAAPEGELAAATLPLEEATTLAAPMPEGESWEEAATKLDLARAYVEMGDKEGAREILEEVLQEGGPEQKEDARKLLATLG